MRARRRPAGPARGVKFFRFQRQTWRRQQLVDRYLMQRRRLLAAMLERNHPTKAGPTQVRFDGKDE